MKSRRQERAIFNYLEQLLNDESPSSAPVIDAPPIRPKMLDTSIAKLLDGIEQRVTETPAKTVAPNALTVAPPTTPPTTPEASSTVVAQAATTTVATGASTTLSPPSLAEVIAQFRQQLPDRFQAIVFRVDDLKLALPLHLLGGIQKREKGITPLPGKPSWFMGLLQHEPENVQVVNTGRYLLGKRFEGDMGDYEFIVVVGNSTWGLACHELYTTIELTNDDIRWFAAAERRPWLAGMLREQMCALLNSDALVLMLQQSLKKAA